MNFFRGENFASKCKINLFLKYNISSDLKSFVLNQVIAQFSKLLAVHRSFVASFDAKSCLPAMKAVMIAATLPMASATKVSPPILPNEFLVCINHHSLLKQFLNLAYK
jgi:hypothetical protein